MAAVEVVLTMGEEKYICQFNQFPLNLALQPNEETGMLFLRWRRQTRNVNVLVNQLIKNLIK